MVINPPCAICLAILRMIRLSLWHAADDENVPVENSLLFAGALSRHQVPFDLHIFESGGHGLGLAEGHPEVKAWPELCEAWLRKRNFS